MEIRGFLKKIQKYSIIGIDTCCFIYQFEANLKFGPLAQALFRYISFSKKKTGVTSTITLAELLSLKGIMEDKKRSDLLKVLFYSVPNLLIESVSDEIAIEASKFRAVYSINLADAIQIATAYNRKAEAFVTNDKKLKKVKDIDVLLFSEFV